MMAPLARLLDWWVIQSLMLPMEARLWHPRNFKGTYPGPAFEEILAFIHSPQFLPEASEPARLEFAGSAAGHTFSFPSPLPGDCPENNRAHGQLFRCPGEWQARPVVLFLHGLLDFPDYYRRFPRMARDYNAAGLNTATLMLPYHFQRRPRAFGLLGVPTLAQWVRGVAQAVAEIRALTGWLLAEGCPEVVLCGVSLGAYLTGLMATCERRLAGAIMIMPTVGLQHVSLAADRVVWPRVRAFARAARPGWERLDGTRLNLVTARPVLAQERILIVESVHDLIAARGPTEALWAAWGEPEIWRRPDSHLSLFNTAERTELPGQVRGWVERVLEKRGANS